MAVVAAFFGLLSQDIDVAAQGSAVLGIAGAPTGMWGIDRGMTTLIDTA